jgi:hypothetical protein
MLATAVDWRKGKVMLAGLDEVVMADEFVTRSFSLPKSTVGKLMAVTKARHGRVERFVSATLDQLIKEAFEKLSPEEQKEAEKYDE